MPTWQDRLYIQPSTSELLLGWVHEQFPARKHFGWQTGYGAFTVSASRSEEVRNHIATQETHHQRVSFQEEFLTLLKRHGLGCSASDVWG